MVAPILRDVHLTVPRSGAAGSQVPVDEAVVTCHTGRHATACTVVAEYGRTTAYGVTTAPSPSGGFHRLTLSDVTPGVTHHARLVATDPTDAGNPTTSQDYSWLQPPDALGAGARYDDEVLADAPVAYWRLGETAGTAAADATGNGRTGTYTGGVALGQAGPLPDGGLAPGFDGSNDQVTVAHAAAFNLTGDLTIEAWVFVANFGDYRPVLTKGLANGATTNTFEFRLDSTTGLPTFGQTTGGGVQTVTGAGALSSGVWSHLAVTKAGTVVTHYRNGAPNGTGTISSTGVTTGTQLLRIGARDDAIFWYLGRLADVALYGTALPAARIAAHYAARA